MSSVKKILVGVDFSDPSKFALQRAFSLAKKWEASLAVLHVLRDWPYEGAQNSIALVELMGKLQEEASLALAKFVKEVAGGSDGVEMEVRIGVPYHDLLVFANEIKADLIVVGCEIKKGLEGLFLGNTAEAVVRKSWIPTWVEGGKEIGAIKNILIPTDLSKNSHSALQKDLNWVRQLGANVLFLHVAETPYIPAFSLIDPKDYEAKMIEIAQKHFEEFLKKLSLQGISYETQQCEGVPATEIVRQAQKIKADLIMLSTHGQTGLGYRLLGTVATKVLRHAPCSVLLTRPESLDFSWLKKEILSA